MNMILSVLGTHALHDYFKFPACPAGAHHADQRLVRTLLPGICCENSEANGTLIGIIETLKA